MKKYVYTHLYLTKNTHVWASMFLDQMYELERSGLMQQADAVIVSAIGSEQDRALLKSMITNYGGKVFTDQFWDSSFETDEQLLRVNEEYQHRFLGEEHTLNRLWLHAQREPDAYFCFIHPKGLMADARFLQREGNPDAITFQYYYWWRKFLEYNVIERWAYCIGILDGGYDIAGPNLCHYPAVHYSGAFWWAKGSFIATLTDPLPTEWWDQYRSNCALNSYPYRLRAEMWIGTNKAGKLYNLADVPTSTPGPTLAEYGWRRHQFAEDAYETLLPVV